MGKIHILSANSFQGLILMNYKVKREDVWQVRRLTAYLCMRQLIKPIPEAQE